MNELGKEELKKYLKEWFDLKDCYSDEDCQAYSQIYDLIENSDIATWMDKYHEAMVENGKLKKQLGEKPEVLMEDVHNLAARINFIPTNVHDLERHKEIIVKWLKSKGIEVTE